MTSDTSIQPQAPQKTTRRPRFFFSWSLVAVVIIVGTLLGSLIAPSFIHSFTQAASQCDTTNIAAKKTATASSVENDRYPAANAVDEQTDTRWSSEWKEPQWLMIDLTTQKTLCEIDLQWEAAYARSYTLESSNDGTTWTKLYGTEEGKESTERISVNGSGRYIRLSTTVRGSKYGVSLWEVRVFAQPNGSNGSGSNNLAANKAATSSSIEDGPYCKACEAKNAVDGNPATRWSTEFKDPQWLQVDLGTSTAITKVELQWETAYAKAYEIHVSEDAKTWTSIAKVTNGKGGTETLAVTGKGRYIRMNGTERSTQYGYSLWEFRVFGAGSNQPPTTTPTPTTTTSPTGEIKTTVLAKGLEIPWSVAFLPDGTALMSQREKGIILSFDPKTGKTATVQTLPSKNIGEGGLLGLAVSPNYAQDKFVYAYYTTDTDNRVVRFQLGGKETTIITGIPNGTYHNGGRIAFGPDGLLYIGTGDATKGNNAQELNSLSGKILRLTPDGKVPSTNPFPNNPVYTYGHRNVQGLSWNSKGELYASELGQDTYDEINHIVAGDNYGWPVVEGIGKQAKYHDPITTFTTAEASPSGVTFLNNGAIPQWEGNFFMTSLRGQQLWRVVIDDTGKMVSKEALYKGSFGRLRCIVQAPDGSLWLTTTNHDQNGKPTADDDRLIRIYVDGGTTNPTTDNDTDPDDGTNLNS